MEYLPHSILTGIFLREESPVLKAIPDSLLGNVGIFALPPLILTAEANEKLVLCQKVDLVAWFRCWYSVIVLQLRRIIASCPVYRFCQAADRASNGVHSVAFLSITQFLAPLLILVWLIYFSLREVNFAPQATLSSARIPHPVNPLSHVSLLSSPSLSPLFV